MKARKIAMLVTMAVGTMLAASKVNAADEMKGEMAAKEAQHAAAVVKSVCVCPDCHTMAMNAGDCAKCGKKMTESHLLGVKDGQALLCGCGAGCKCDAGGMKDGKCSCGKDVTKVSAKGMYACPEGCPVISDMAGKCGGCGKELKKVE